MPRIEVRTAVLEDITAMMELDHSYHTDYVWQMDVITEDKYVGVNFQENGCPDLSKWNTQVYQSSYLKIGSIGMPFW